MLASFDRKCELGSMFRLIILDSTVALFSKASSVFENADIFRISVVKIKMLFILVSFGSSFALLAPYSVAC